MAQSATKSLRCSTCPGSKRLSDFYVFKDGRYKGRRRTGQCRACNQKRARNYARLHPRKVRAKSRRYHLENRLRLIEQMRLRNIELKKQALAAYGGRCSCCGEAEMWFLAIDHVKGGGNRHRKEIGVKGGAQFYRWLATKGFPRAYRVLCHNCNVGRHLNGGTCPHLKA